MWIISSSFLKNGGGKGLFIWAPPEVILLPALLAPKSFRPPIAMRQDYGTRLERNNSW